MPDDAALRFTVGMFDAEIVRRLALGLPEVVDATDGERLRFEVDGRGFAWTYLERVQPKKPRVARPEVIAICCDMPRKEMLLDAAPEVFFDDEHYRGYPAVLVRLARVGEAELGALLEAGWRRQAPKRLGGLAGKRGAG